MNKKLYILQVFFGILEAIYLNSVCDNPFEFMKRAEDGFAFLDVIRWIIFLLPVWAISLWQYEEGFYQMRFTIYRHYKILKWWKRLNFRIMLQVINLYIFLFLILIFLRRFNISLEDYRTIGNTLLHILGLLALGSWCRLLFGNAVLSGIGLIVFEVFRINFLIDFEMKNSFLIFVQSCLVMSMFITNSGVIKDGIIRRLLYEKND